jgi:hypothetical protein
MAEWSIRCLRVRLLARVALALACVTATPGSALAVDYGTLVESLGPVSYWRLGETSGTTAADELGANTGTYVNGVSINQNGALADDTNRCARFDGDNDYVNIGTMNVGGSAMTIVCWFNADNFSDNDARFISKSNGGATANQWWSLCTADSSGMKLDCYLKTSSTTAHLTATSGGLTAGQWTFAAMVYNGSTLRLYKDAVQVGSTSLTGTISTSGSVSARIGGNPDGTDDFDGGLDEVAVFNKALTAAELTLLYRVGRGLVGHWKLDETSGTNADDASPYDSDGALTGGLSFSSDSVTGVYSRGLNFNGSTDYISVPNDSTLQLTDALTIAAWIKGDAWGAGSDVDAIVRKGDTGPNNYHLGIADGRVTLCLDQSDTAGIRGDTVLETGRWHHVAATWDGSQVKIYVNGELDATPVSRSGTIATDTRALHIGGRSGADLFDGVLDDVRIYTYALDQADIYRLYGLVGHWTFNEGSGSQAADSSGHGHDAALYGNTAWLIGRRSKAVTFDGSGDYVRTAANFTPPGDGSISFWMKPGSIPSVRQRIFGLSSSWEIRHETTGRLIFDVGTTSGDGALETTTALAANQWRHVALVYSASADTYQIYLDGVLHKSGSAALSSQTAGLLSFGVRTGATDYWLGALDDVRVFDRGLSAQEVAAFGASVSIRIIKWIELQ